MINKCTYGTVRYQVKSHWNLLISDLFLIAAYLRTDCTYTKGHFFLSIKKREREACPMISQGFQLLIQPQRRKNFPLIFLFYSHSYWEEDWLTVGQFNQIINAVNINVKSESDSRGGERGKGKSRTRVGLHFQLLIFLFIYQLLCGLHTAGFGNKTKGREHRNWHYYAAASS